MAKNRHPRPISTGDVKRMGDSRAMMNHSILDLAKIVEEVFSFSFVWNTTKLLKSISAHFRFTQK
jgi:hypothetical protein